MYTWHYRSESIVSELELDRGTASVIIAGGTNTPRRLPYQYFTGLRGFEGECQSSFCSGNYGTCGPEWGIWIHCKVANEVSGSLYIELRNCLAPQKIPNGICCWNCSDLCPSAGARGCVFFKYLKSQADFKQRSTLCLHQNQITVFCG